MPPAPAPVLPAPAPADGPCALAPACRRPGCLVHVPASSALACPGVRSAAGRCPFLRRAADEPLCAWCSEWAGAGAPGHVAPTFSERDVWRRAAAEVAAGGKIVGLRAQCGGAGAPAALQDRVVYDLGGVVVVLRTTEANMAVALGPTDRAIAQACSPRPVAVVAIPRRLLRARAALDTLRRLLAVLDGCWGRSGSPAAPLVGYGLHRAEGATAAAARTVLVRALASRPEPRPPRPAVQPPNWRGLPPGTGCAAPGCPAVRLPGQGLAFPGYCRAHGGGRECWRRAEPGCRIAVCELALRANAGAPPGVHWPPECAVHFSGHKCARGPACRTGGVGDVDPATALVLCPGCSDCGGPACPHPARGFDPRCPDFAAWFSARLVAEE